MVWRYSFGVNAFEADNEIARKLTSIGRKDYVYTFLKANLCIFIQKGHFHQLIHQVGVIYTLFYGGFMPPMQLANGAKRVTGDPVKSNFQDNEQFILKLYKVCCDFQFYWLTESKDLEELQSKVGESSKETLR